MRRPEKGDVWKDSTPGLDRLVEILALEGDFVRVLVHGEFRDYGKEFEMLIPLERFDVPRGYAFERNGKK